MKKITIDCVREFVKKNSDCELISDSYDGVHSCLNFNCKCGNEFKSSFSNFKHNNKRTCNICSTFKLKEITCLHCEEKFRPRNSKTKFCCIECKGNYYKTEVVFSCDNCNKTNGMKKSQYNKSLNHFCNRKCSDEYQNNRVKYNCDYCGKEKETSTGNYNKYKTHFCSNECSGEYKKNKLLTDEQRERGRFRKIDKKWSFEIKRKYNGTCVICNSSKSDKIKIVAHHLDGWNASLNGRLDTENGVCLCEECHKEFHRLYGYGNNTKQQFLDFIKQGNTEVTNRIKEMLAP